VTSTGSAAGSITAGDAERAAARLLCIGFDGTTLPRETRSLLERGVSAVILFARNVESHRQVAELCRDIKDAVPHPVAICIDQEGGDVQRLRDGFTTLPAMRDVGATGDREAARAIGRTLATELRSIHVDLDLAPVLDVDSNPDNPVIGARSFSADPDVVASLGTALIEGLQGGGVAACAKHFPGHGDTTLDSHHDLPRIAHGLDRLRAVELPPFRAAIKTDVAAIMTAHIVMEKIDPDRPATMSHEVIAGLLRGELAYEGVVISDDLEMEAITGRWPISEAAVNGINAGLDLLLICHQHDRQLEALDALTSAIKSGAIEADRVNSAHDRLTQLYDRYVKR